MLAFDDQFKEGFIGQGLVNRSLEETLQLAWELLELIPPELLKRIPQQYIEKYHRKS